MSSMKKIWMLLSVVLLSAAGYGLWTYFKPHKNIEATTASEKINEDVLYDEFARDATAAHQKYTDKVIAVSGVVKAVQADSSSLLLTMDKGGKFALQCYFTQLPEKLPEEGKSILVKGLYNAFIEPDEMFGTPGYIQLNQCVIEK